MPSISTVAVFLFLVRVRSQSSHCLFSFSQNVKSSVHTLVQPASIKAEHQCSLSSQSDRQTPGQSSQDRDYSHFNHQNGYSPQTCSTSVCHMKIQQPINFQAVACQSMTVMGHTAFPIFKTEIFPNMKSTLFSFLQSNAVENLKAPAQLYSKCPNQHVKILHCTVISPQIQSLHRAGE